MKAKIEKYVELEQNSILHIMSMTRENKTRKKQHSKWPVAGNRCYTQIQFGKKRVAVKALYDTGASVTIIPVEVFRLARQAGAVRSEITGHGVSLTNASGQAMPIQGVYWMVMRIAGREMLEPVVVGRRVTSSIIGQNIIEGQGLCYNPKKRKFFLSTQ